MRSIMLRGEHLKRQKYKYLRGTIRFLFSLVEAHIFTLRIYLAQRYPYRDAMFFGKHDNIVNHLRMHMDHILRFVVVGFISAS